MSPNKLVISLEGNDELKDYLSKKSPGETCEFEVKASMDEMTPEQAVFSVKDIEAYSEEEYSTPPESTTEGSEMGESEMEGSEKAPAAVMLAFAKKK